MTPYYQLNAILFKFFFSNAVDFALKVVVQVADIKSGICVQLCTREKLQVPKLRSQCNLAGELFD